jgi:hypothetical protein
MSISIALSWRNTPRHPIVPITETAVRTLLQMTAARGIFPAPALHCDPHVGARDLSIQVHSLATIVRSTDADDALTAILEEAQFTRSKIRLLTCPLSNSLLVTVSPTIDFELSGGYFAYIADALQLGPNSTELSYGSADLEALLASLATKPERMTHRTFSAATALVEDLQPYLPAPRKACLLWQAQGHIAAPLYPTAIPTSITRNSLTLDAGTGRMFGTIDGARGPRTVCLSGDADTPHAWDRLIAIDHRGLTTRIGSFRPEAGNSLTLDDAQGSSPLYASFHHDAATPQPTLRLDPTPHAQSRMDTLHA